MKGIAHGRPMPSFWWKAEIAFAQPLLYRYSVLDGFQRAWEFDEEGVSMVLISLPSYFGKKRAHEAVVFSEQTHCKHFISLRCARGEAKHVREHYRRESTLKFRDIVPRTSDRGR